MHPAVKEGISTGKCSSGPDPVPADAAALLGRRKSAPCRTLLLVQGVGLVDLSKINFKGARAVSLKAQKDLKQELGIDKRAVALEARSGIYLAKR